MEFSGLEARRSGVHRQARKFAGGEMTAAVWSEESAYSNV